MYSTKCLTIRSLFKGMIQDIEEHDLSTNEVNNLEITFLPSAESLSATVFPKDNYNDEYHFS